jgi:large subunit ribosomal protein L18e
MRARNKNPPLAGLIKKLEERGRQDRVPLWSDLARRLNRPRRVAYEVNLFRLDRNAKARETVVVPGYVLGSGELKKPVYVVALKFSGKAEAKIKKAGGRCIPMEKVIEDDMKGLRILG